MSSVRYINIALQSWGIIISLTILLFLGISQQLKKDSGKLFILILVSNIGTMGFDLIALAFRGNPTFLGFVMVRIANFCSFLSVCIVTFSFLLFEKKYIEERSHKKLPDRFNRAAVVIFFIEVLLLVINLFYPFIYQFDTENRYSRMAGYPVIHTFTFILLFMGLVMLIRSQSRLRSAERVGILFVILVPFLTMILTVRYYGIVFGQAGATTSIIIMYVSLQAENERIMMEEREELMQYRISIMKSQIQPHFMFNALNSIEYLCNICSPDAGKAVNHFAKYLRGNVDTLAEVNLIPVEQEINHLKNYLYIEKLRFPQIEVEYRLNCVDFMVPPLSLQPLVENSIKHGLRNKKENARVIITTEESTKGYFISVEDNGKGFPQQTDLQKFQKMDTQRKHVGLKNIQERLHLLCNGTLDIQSEPNKKTIVTIFIPK